MSESDPRATADAEWEDLLQQWRAQSSDARPRPFFYQRVRARLVTGEPTRPWWAGGLRRPAYAVALGLLVVALSGDCAALSSTSGALPAHDQPRPEQPAAPAR